LILAAAALHLAYLVFDCPLDLAPDEAHYWDWSRHLDWSYYSKGPLVAYLIRGSIIVFGPMARAWTGSEMPAVRLPAVISGAFLLASLHVLTVQILGRPKWGAAVVASALTLPILSAGSLLMTIDAPYTCCWGWALVLGHRAIFRPAWWAWLAAGFLVGLGILAKYTMVLWIPSVALFLLATPRFRSRLWRSGFWSMIAVAAACCLPIVIWNVAHDWVTFRHVAGQAGISSAPAGVLWLGPLRYVCTQFALLLGFWFIAWALAMIGLAPWRTLDAGVRFLWWTSTPMFATFLLFSFKTPEEPNWPMTAYLSGLVLTFVWLQEQLAGGGGRRAGLLRGALVAVCGLGLAFTVLIHHTEWAQPLLAELSGPRSEAHPLPVRRFDPTCRLRGWQTLAGAVDEMAAKLREEGIEPILAGTSWTLPGELGFYGQHQPTVYSIGPALGDRHSQYDLWHPNPVGDPGEFAGRTFIVVGDQNPRLLEGFACCDAPVTVAHYQGNDAVARWTVTICRGFRGFAAGEQRSSQRF
jgi:4-amino-4-deoxy-L-arabinose transferase-like glycosyltransferase